MEYYSAIKEQSVMHVISWRNVKNIMLNESSRHTKFICHMISLICHIWNNPIHRDRMQVSDYQGMSEENVE